MNTDPISLGAWTACFSPAYQRAEFGEAVLEALEHPAEHHEISGGRNRIFTATVDGKELAFKSFGAQAALKEHFDQRGRGSKAKRSFDIASQLANAGVGTPQPIAYLERWESGRLAESLYLSRFEADLTSFKDELIRLFHHQPLCADFMQLMETVAESIRAMHEAGVAHMDLGNQNILLRSEGRQWKDLQFIDLNRARVHEPLSLQHRARDLSRIYLPSDLRRVFYEMYFAPEAVPDDFQQHEKRLRKRFDLHSQSRALRHPLREARVRQQKAISSVDRYPPERDMWIWDHRSVQAIPALRSRDKRKHYKLGSHLKIAFSHSADFLRANTDAKASVEKAWNTPVDLTGRIGLGISSSPEKFSTEAAWLADLVGEKAPALPVLMRLYHHDGPERWTTQLQHLRALNDRGHAVSIALIQDRAALLTPHSWASFVTRVFEASADWVDWIEAAHAINRVKWGLWDLDEYRQLIEPIAAEKKRFPNVKVMGPAVIDFEAHYVSAALRSLPEGFQFDALSHHLYVDRRGAPENRQGQRDTIDKLAFLDAIGRNNGISNGVIISETNWPLQDTGVWSPVVSPYDSPGPREKDPNVSEEQYARYMIRYLLMTLCSGLAGRVYWWRLAAHGFGLIDDRDPGGARKRPAFDALAELLQRTADARFVDHRTDESETVYGFEAKQNFEIVCRRGELPVYQDIST